MEILKSRINLHQLNQLTIKLIDKTKGKEEINVIRVMKIIHDIAKKFMYER